MQPIAARQWSSGFLPSKFQGVKFNSIGDPVLYIQNPARLELCASEGFDRRNQRAEPLQYEALQDPEVLTRIAQYEMAFKMQTSVPELMDMSTGTGKRPGDVRREARRWLVCLQLPAGPAAGRAGRAVHSALSSRLGSPRQREEQRRHQSPGDGSSHGCADQGPETARNARDTLVVWGGSSAARRCRKAATAATITSRASHSCSLAAESKAAWLRSDGRTWLRGCGESCQRA